MIGATTTWITVGGLAVTAFATKAIGPLLFGARELPSALARIARLFAPALLAGLIAVDTLSGPGRSLTLDARSVGLAAAAVALLLRAPVLVVVLSAVAATVLVRAVG
jgi:Branched-chain amino acid transport protein (AzlD)